MNLDDLRASTSATSATGRCCRRSLSSRHPVIAILAPARCSTGRISARSLDARAEETAAQGAVQAEEGEGGQLDLYVQQLQGVEQSFGALLKQLPNKSEMDALLTDINQAGLGRGLQFELFRPASQERIADFYAELPISVRVTGTYHDMGAFASDVAQLPRIVTLNDIGIANDRGTLTMEATAKTFRYLDEEEIAKQRKAAKDAKDKGKK
jgi:type IV pilus assembly protein PilO